MLLRGLDQRGMFPSYLGYTAFSFECCGEVGGGVRGVRGGEKGEGKEGEDRGRVVGGGGGVGVENIGRLRRGC